MPSYQLDPLHPEVLRCADCREPVARVGGTVDPVEAAHDLSATQAARTWPEHAAAIRDHDVLCFWHEHPVRADFFSVDTCPRQAGQCL